MANLLTFQFLRDLQKQEKESKILNNLDPNFYNDIANYLNTKLKQKNLQETEKRHTELVIKDIINTREMKIINSAMINMKTELECENLLSEEIELYNNILKTLRDYRDKIENITDKTPQQTGSDKIKDNKIKTREKDKEEQAEKNNNKKMQKLRILNNIPKFMAEDSKSYGPYEKDKEVEIPKRAADLLVQMKKAEIIK